MLYQLLVFKEVLKRNSKKFKVANKREIELTSEKS